MTKIKNGGSAAPVVYRMEMGPDGIVHMDMELGMSLRDAAAIAALPAVIDAFDPDMRHVGETTEQMFARLAFGVADAFIAARETGEK